MSDDSNVTVEGEIDAAYSSYWDPEIHGQMNKTVDVHDSEGDGEIDYDHIPKEADLDSLSESEREIIITAARNVKQSTNDIASALDLSAPHIRNTLREYVPNYYNNIFKESGKSNQNRGRSNGGYDYEKFYDLVAEYNGISASELATEVQCSQKTARKALCEGVKDGILRKKTGVDGYHGRTTVYYPTESDTEASETDSDCESNDEEDEWKTAEESVSVGERYLVDVADEPEQGSQDFETVTSDNDGSDHFTEGDKEALNELFGESVATDELHAVIEAMKATATNDETVNALCVVENYL